MSTPESVFTYGAPQLKFGSGASDEIGFDLSQFGVRRVLVVTDPGLAATGLPQRVTEAMAAYGIEARLWDGVHVEPTDASLLAAADAALYEAKRRGKDCVAWVDLDESERPIDDRVAVSHGAAARALHG